MRRQRNENVRKQRDVCAVLGIELLFQPFLRQF